MPGGSTAEGTACAAPREAVLNAPSDVATRFIHAFARGDIDQLDRLVHDTVHISGPLGQFKNRADYISALRADPPEAATVESMEVSSDTPGIVWISCEYVRTTHRLFVEHQFCVEQGRVASLRLDFEPNHLN